MRTSWFIPLIPLFLTWLAGCAQLPELPGSPGASLPPSVTPTVEPPAEPSGQVAPGGSGKPAESKPRVEPPAEAHPGDGKAAEVRGHESRPGETRGVEPKPESRPPEPAPPAVVAAEPAPPAEEAVAVAATAMDWLKPAAWKELAGWKEDDLAQAWPAFLESCKVLRKQQPWQAVCRSAGRLNNPDAVAVREFFERGFRLYQVNQAEGGQEGLVTGYYEPLLRGARQPGPRYRYPLHAPPDDLLVVDLAGIYPELKALRLRGRLQGNKVVPYYTRADIDAGRAPLHGKEIAWVEDPVELFFLQVQGSGRIQLDSGEIMRVGYADQNGHPYRSIGRWLVEQGELTLDKASMQGIKDWARRNPPRLAELLGTNPSYVFFRELENAQGGPIGSLGVPLTPERSVAVDPRAIPLGAPLWLATTRPNSSEVMNRLVLAQDTGSAIRGNVRADFFWGFGPDAGRLAGAMKQKGRVWLLLPKDYPILLSQAGAGR